LISLTPKATRQVAELTAHYTRKQRPEALRNMRAALVAVREMIERHPNDGHPFPSVYDDLVAPGRSWVQSGRYWVAYSPKDPPVIVGFFYETADIPTRL
jgi:plasmid stabilization system protein ParE